MIAAMLNSLSTGALDWITELKRRNTDLIAVRLFSMESSRLASWRNCTCGWSDCSSMKKFVEVVPVVAVLKVIEPLDSELCSSWMAFSNSIEHLSFKSRLSNQYSFNFVCETAASRNSVSLIRCPKRLLITPNRAAWNGLDWDTNTAFSFVCNNFKVGNANPKEAFRSPWTASKARETGSISDVYCYERRVLSSYLYNYYCYVLAIVLLLWYACICLLVECCCLSTQSLFQRADGRTC